MKICVIVGTPLNGITFFMKEAFLRDLREGNEIREFYPKDMPPFCLGCKSCFLRGERNCPHSSFTEPVWEAIMEAELLVFAYPVYALRAPASIKSLLDHTCVHWLVHRPEPALFTKSAVIITNSVGAPNGSAQRDVITSLNWMGLSRVHCAGAPMMGDIFIDKLTDKHRAMLERRMRRLAAKVGGSKLVCGMSLKVRLLFAMTRLQHKIVLKGETEPSLDNRHYIEHGWIKR